MKTSIQTSESVLEIELKRQKHFLAKLEASTAELKLLLEEDRSAGRPADPDYKEAVDDNIVTIAKYRASIEALEKQVALAALSAGQASGHDASAHRQDQKAQSGNQQQQEAVTQTSSSPAANMATQGSDSMQVDGVNSGQPSTSLGVVMASEDALMRTANMNTGAVGACTHPREHTSATAQQGAEQQQRQAGGDAIQAHGNEGTWL